MKRIYKYMRYGRPYYKASIYILGIRKQSSFVDLADAEKWLNSMAVPADIQDMQPIGRWYKVEFDCLVDQTPMHVVPYHRCLRYWDCRYQYACLSFAAQRDWPGWAEFERAEKFYRKIQIKKEVKQIA